MKMLEIERLLRDIRKSLECNNKSNTINIGQVNTNLGDLSSKLNTLIASQKQSNLELQSLNALVNNTNTILNGISVDTALTAQNTQDIEELIILSHTIDPGRDTVALHYTSLSTKLITK